MSSTRSPGFAAASRRTPALASARLRSMSAWCSTHFWPVGPSQNFFWSALRSSCISNPLPENRGVAIGAVGKQRIVRNDASFDPAQPLVQPPAVAVRDGVKRQQATAFAPRDGLRRGHQRLADALAARGAVDKQLL